MPDPIFSDPRLAAIYDAFDGSRGDLDAYEELLLRLGARRALDLGCGTGSFAVRLARLGLDATGVDPAAASLDVARRKPGAEAVTWIEGDASDLPPMQFDVAVMTGNVAQVFLTDESWSRTLTGLHAALVPGGHLVFETRDPARSAWEDWATDPDDSRVRVAGIGVVTHRRVVTRVDLPLVSFRHEYTFEDGTVIPSESTLRFRSPAEVTADLDAAGFLLLEIRDAADRPGAEHVYLARRVAPPS